MEQPNVVVPAINPATAREASADRFGYTSANLTDPT